jgi:hypothetical protein
MPSFNNREIVNRVGEDHKKETKIRKDDTDWIKKKVIREERLLTNTVKETPINRSIINSITTQKEKNSLIVNSNTISRR